MPDNSTITVENKVLLPAVDSTGKAINLASPNGRTALASVPYVSGFSFPFGSDKVYTAASDRDGWYNAQGLVYEVATGKTHLGEDWNSEDGGNSEQGFPCYAMAEGEVIYSAKASDCWGNVIILRHNLPNGTQVETLYGHLSVLKVKVGDVVARRSQIGNIGGKGLVCGGNEIYAHLHLEARYSNCPSWGKPGPGSSTSTTGWVSASNLVYKNFPTVPVTLSTPADGASIRSNVFTLFAWQNYWLLSANSRIQVAYSATSSPPWSSQSGFQSGLVYNNNIGQYNGIYFKFSGTGSYWWCVQSTGSGYSSTFTSPRRVVITP